MKYEKYKKYIEETLNTKFDNEELVIIHNEYCLKTKQYDDIIMTWHELLEYLENFSTIEEVFMLGINSQRCNIYNDYFIIDGYGNIQSTNFPIERYVKIDEIASYIIDKKESFGYDELEELIEYWYSEDDISDNN